MRSVSMPLQRVREAQKLGFDTVILPDVCKRQVKDIAGITLIGVRSVRDAIQAVL